MGHQALLPDALVIWKTMYAFAKVPYESTANRRQRVFTCCGKIQLNILADKSNFQDISIGDSVCVGSYQCRIDTSGILGKNLVHSKVTSRWLSPFKGHPPGWFLKAN